MAGYFLWVYSMNPLSYKHLWHLVASVEPREGMPPQRNLTQPETRTNSLSLFSFDLASQERSFHKRAKTQMSSVADYYLNRLLLP